MIHIADLITISKGCGWASRSHTRQATDRRAVALQAVVGSAIVPCHHEHLQSHSIACKCFTVWRDSILVMPDFLNHPLQYCYQGRIWMLDPLHLSFASIAICSQRTMRRKTKHQTGKTRTMHTQHHMVLQPIQYEQQHCGVLQDRAQQAVADRHGLVNQHAVITTTQCKA